MFLTNSFANLEERYKNSGHYVLPATPNGTALTRNRQGQSPYSDKSLAALLLEFDGKL